MQRPWLHQHSQGNTRGEYINVQALRLRDGRSLQRACREPSHWSQLGTGAATLLQRQSSRLAQALVRTAQPQRGAGRADPLVHPTAPKPGFSTAGQGRGGEAGRGTGSGLPEVSTEGSRLPTAPSQLPLLCHWLSRDTNCLSKGVACSKNELVMEVRLLASHFWAAAFRGEIHKKKDGTRHKPALTNYIPTQFQWLWWSCKWDCCYMWTETIGPNQWHAVIRPPVLQETHWPKLIKHTMRDTRDHIWKTTGSSSLTRVPKLKLHQYFSWCITVGSFCLKVKQNLL